MLNKTKPKRFQQRRVYHMDMEIFESAEFGELRVVDESGEPWFVASDVAKSLGYRMASDMTRRIDSSDKDTRSMRTPSGIQEMSVINEPGLYSAVLGSKLPEAKAFKRWVTHEVLPSIRRDGAYVASDGTEDEALLMARGLKAAQRMIERKQQLIDELEPKADLCDAMLLPSKEAYTVSEATRYLANIMPGVKRQDVFDLLRARGMMCQRSTAPTRKGIRTGRMVALASPYIDRHTGEERAGHQRGKLTPKGIGYLALALGGEAA